MKTSVLTGSSQTTLLTRYVPIGPAEDSILRQPFRVDVEKEFLIECHVRG